jgi:2-polyprenyl-3-methyl-5-hydroxy-6-metoxy-1,4-benzoquinol methylase
MWDERYSGEDYAYGTEPNDFLVSVAGELPRGRALCLAEGEGRNAVWLARQGLDVTAVDSSPVGLDKATRLAEKRGVTIQTVHADLAEYEIGSAEWDVIVSIFCHLPPPLRRAVHAGVVAGLKPGGMFVLEAYTPAQLEFRTGGPHTVELMMTLDALREELIGLEFVHARELERVIREGKYHGGTGAVVQLLGTKPR